jgi:hypothetical protein
MKPTLKSFVRPSISIMGRLAVAVVCARSIAKVSLARGASFEAFPGDSEEGGSQDLIRYEVGVLPKRPRVFFRSREIYSWRGRMGSVHLFFVDGKVDGSYLGCAQGSVDLENDLTRHPFQLDTPAVVEDGDDQPFLMETQGCGYSRDVTPDHTDPCGKYALVAGLVGVGDASQDFWQ